MMAQHDHGPRVLIPGRRLNIHITKSRFYSNNQEGKKNRNYTNLSTDMAKDGEEEKKNYKLYQSVGRNCQKCRIKENKIKIVPICLLKFPKNAK